MAVSGGVSGGETEREQQEEERSEIPREETKALPPTTKATATDDMTATSVTSAAPVEPGAVSETKAEPVLQNANDALKQNRQHMNTSPQQHNNNNYSGLNLNMTASQMRELIASRKKFDPKKAQMNIRQKYEIIQQM